MGCSLSAVKLFSCLSDSI